MYHWRYSPFSSSVGGCIYYAHRKRYWIDFRYGYGWLLLLYQKRPWTLVRRSRHHSTVSHSIHSWISFDTILWWNGTILYRVILCVIGSLVVLASGYEYLRIVMNSPIDPKRDSFLIRSLHCFSLVTNCRKLLSTASPSDNLGCVNGIRVLSTTWVVMGHSYFMLAVYYHHGSFVNVETVSILSRKCSCDLLTSLSTDEFSFTQDLLKWQSYTIINATVSVDTFFLLSGMLVSYLLLRELDRNKGRFNLLLFYVHRYLRYYIMLLTNWYEQTVVQVFFPKAVVSLFPFLLLLLYSLSDIFLGFYFILLLFTLTTSEKIPNPE